MQNGVRPSVLTKALRGPASASVWTILRTMAQGSTNKKAKKKKKEKKERAKREKFSLSYLSFCPVVFLLLFWSVRRHAPMMMKQPQEVTRRTRT